MRFHNPIGKRLEFVRKQYASRPEVYEKTVEIVAKTLGQAPSEIDPKATVAWEKYIPWLAKNINVLAKKHEQGIPVASQMRKLEAGFRQSLEPFLKPRIVKKGARRVELAKLTPKQARKYQARSARMAHEKKQAQAESAGYRIVKNLGDGYVAVVGRPNFKASPWPSRREDQEAWVEENARFQQWLGVTMKNCLQFFEVNYVAYGDSKFEVQRKGGKLYAILDPKGHPVVAILTNQKGRVIETNGPKNQPPPESAMPYLEKFEKLMGWSKFARGAFVAPEGFDPKLVGAIAALLDSAHFTENLRDRRYFIRKAQGYARQAGADFSKVWPAFAIHILEGSKYSTLVSVKKVDYPKKWEIIKRICRVVRLYKKGGSQAEFKAAAAAAWMVGEDAAGAGEIADVAKAAEAAAAAWAATWAARAARAVATAVAEARVADVEAVARVALDRATWTARLAAGAFGATRAARAAARAAGEAADQDYAKKLLELMRQAASQAGRNLQQAPRRAANPKRRKTAKRKAKKKAVRKTTAPWQRQISKCQKLWEYYCERPSKKRLKEVFDHLEKMKASKAKSVKSERSRCLRVANLEAKRIKLK